jgi:hypothetical protein
MIPLAFFGFGTRTGGESQRAGGASAIDNGAGKPSARGGAGDPTGSPDRPALLRKRASELDVSSLRQSTICYASET